MTCCIALIVAAGRGTRVGGPLPKQYLSLAGQPLLRHAVTAFASHPAISGVRIVYHPDDRALYEAATAGFDILPPVAGGAARQDSVRLGLESLESLSPERVLIHDGARPFIRHALIDRMLAALDETPGAIPALAIRDTVKRGQDGIIRETLDRTSLWRAQTPQGFRYDAILAAHRASAGRDLSDDAAVAEAVGLAVRLIEGDEENFKVTTSDDLARAERVVAARQGDVRSGMGFDVHAFGPGDHVWLCGVRLTFEQGLVGHSDADVGLHALTDAILGALGAGDIGQHFPPSDARWRGASSDRFIRHAADLVTAAGGSIVHLDLTLICERPKIGPHREAMVHRISDILSLDPGRVSVKATTTEGLGFTGRREGIAGQAVATIRLPL
jgi:2-C-methyl-D-erythritol 4-phosphate cytidylyltransferase/2-C-methyl-D-erythritol 2,4-cyclodiphosphate synthase